MAREYPRPEPPRIVFAQELGGGYGHALRLALVAKPLAPAGRLFVVRDPDLVRPALVRTLGGEAACRAAPGLRGPRSAPPAPDAGLTAILARLGFGDAAALRVAVAAWRALLDEVRPDLVVSDYAPSLRIAAAGRVPHLAVGNGFVVPPDRAPLPPLLETDTGAEPLADIEARLLAVANGLRREAGQSPFARLAQLLRGDGTIAASLPLLDPYRAVREAPCVAPFGREAAALGPPAGERRGPALFAYLDAGAGAVNPVLTALNGLAAPSQVFVRGIAPEDLARHCAPQVGIHPGPADLGVLLPQVGLVVHAGTLGLAEAALLAGTPQLLVPDTLERELTARALVEAGAGVVMRAGPDSEAGEIRALIAAMLGDAALSGRALALAEAQRRAGQEAALPAARRAALGLLAGRA